MVPLPFLSTKSKSLEGLQLPPPPRGAASGANCDNIDFGSDKMSDESEATTLPRPTGPENPSHGILSKASSVSPAESAASTSPALAMIKKRGASEELPKAERDTTTKGEKIGGGGREIPGVGDRRRRDEEGGGGLDELKRHCSMLELMLTASRREVFVARRARDAAENTARRQKGDLKRLQERVSELEASLEREEETGKVGLCGNVFRTVYFYISKEIYQP